MTFASARSTALALGLLAGIALPAAAAEVKDPVVATVNGTDIHMSQLVEFQRTLPPQLAGAPYDALLDIVVNNQLVYDAAKRDKLESDPEVKATMKQLEQKVLRQAWMSKKLRAGITDDVLKARYDEFVRNFKPEEEVRARHILVETEDQAKAIIADLQKGADFGETAKAKSKDPSAQQNGGDLGYFSKGEMVPQFADAAFAMKAGELSAKPIKSQFGWHVIKVEDRRMASPPPFDAAKPMLREQLAEVTAEKLVMDLKSKAKIKRFGPDGKPLPEQAAEPAKN
ncbi:MAG: peptidylprolyl isomerase [Actinomycetota bacterium]